MGVDSKIEWTDHTFNPWWGCTKVSPGCDHCYAEAFAKRTGHGVWGPGAARRTFGDKHWAEPYAWNAKARDAGKRARVFCASMADVFDNDVTNGDLWRARLFEMIEDTEHLDWLLLTKRIGNVAKMVPEHWRDEFPSNVWLGASIVNQEEADRDVYKLMMVPARVRFLSCEPLLGPIDLDGIWGYPGSASGEQLARWPIHWVIVGGESGPGARPMHPAWARAIRDQCHAAGVAFFFKQWGEWAPHQTVAGGDLGGDVRAGRVKIVHPTGQSDVEVSEQTSGRSTIPGSRYMARVGKKAAGRLLDGRTWDELPR